MLWGAHTERQGEHQIGSIKCIVCRVTLENQSPTHFQASQCIQMDLDADARYVYTLTFIFVHVLRPIYT